MKKEDKELMFTAAARFVADDVAWGDGCPLPGKGLGFRVWSIRCANCEHPLMNHSSFHPHGVLGPAARMPNGQLTVGISVCDGFVSPIVSQEIL